MSIVEAGAEVPEFTLQGEEGSFTRENLRGETTILVFYPFAFSPVCTDQLQIYERELEALRGAGMTRIYGVSTDPGYSQAAFIEKLGVSIPQLSDFEPKGETARAFGAYFEPAGMTNRAIVIVNPDLTVRFSHLAETPGHLPPVELLLGGLAA